MMTRKEWNESNEIIKANSENIKEMYMENSLFELEAYETFEEYVKSQSIQGGRTPFELTGPLLHFTGKSLL